MELLDMMNLAVFLVNLSIFTTGMSMAWPSPVLIKLRNATETPLVQPMSAEDGSWMVSLGFLFGIFYILGGMLCDAIGRRKCLLLSSVPKFLMALVLIFATRPWMLIVGRTIMVTTDCFLYMVVPIYASEVAEKEHRGALGSFLQLFSSFGGLVTLAVGPFTSYITFNIIFASVIGVTSLISLWVPDSPFFLYKKGRIEEATEVLKTLRDSDEIVMDELQEYKAACTKLEGNSDKIKLLKSRTFLKSLGLGLIMCIGVQFVGLNAVMAYLQTIFESTQTNVRPEIASVIIGVLQVVTGFSTILMTQKFRRRTILMVSLSGLFLGLVGMGTFFQITDVKNYKITGFLNYLPIISLVLYICCYCGGIGCLLWGITPELFDSHTRAFGVSTCLISTTFFIFILTKYFPFMNEALGSAGTFWFFASMTAVLTILLGLFLPETKGKTFSEIQTALGKTEGELKNKDDVKLEY